MKPEEKEMKIEIKVDETIAAGIYSNFTNISHSLEEFVLDFLFIHPAPPPGFGKMRSRIIISPGHAKRLFHILSENIREYENRFGEISLHNPIQEAGKLQ